MTAQEVFDAFVREDIWPVLEQHGFTRTKATFHRPVGDNWQVINLQKSRSSDRRRVTFTVNIAVGLGRLREGVHDWADGARPAESRCHLRQRLGVVTEREDGWWKLRTRTGARLTARRVTGDLERHALPWLDARSSDDALVALLRTPGWLQEQPYGDLRWLEQLAAQLGEDDLRRAVAAERARR